MRIFLMTYLSKIVRKYRYLKLRMMGYKNIAPNVIIERGVGLDKINPEGIHIGEGTLVASGTTILSHEHIYRQKDNPFIPFTTDTYIGERCFIGIRAIILPGVKIGNECVIGAGCVVNKDIPAHSMAVGVPAKIVRTGIRMNDKAEMII